MTNWARIQKALNENMSYSLESNDNDIYIFSVRGASGNTYTTEISEFPKCSCPDYVQRRTRCKHQVLCLIKEFGCSVTDTALEASHIELQKYHCTCESECCICMANISGNDIKWECNQCEKIIHFSCMQEWVTLGKKRDIHPSCPMCRFNIEKRFNFSEVKRLPSFHDFP